MTKAGYTHIVALIDASGSMQKVQKDTLGGFNQFLAEQRKVPGEATITLATFNDTYKVIYSDVPLAHVAGLTEETYRCSGWTTLNDSLARIITDVGEKLAAKKEEERPSKVIICVMTDGEENKSKEFIGKEGLNKLKEMVAHQTGKYAWQFVFIGANIDAFATADVYGFTRGTTINYSQSGFGQYNAFKTLSKGVAASRLTSASGQSLNDVFEMESNRSFVSFDSMDLTPISDTINKYKDAKVETTQNREPPIIVEPTKTVDKTKLTTESVK